MLIKYVLGPLKKNLSLSSQRASNFPSASIFFFIFNIFFISYFFSQRTVFQCHMSFYTHSYCIKREYPLHNRSSSTCFSHEPTWTKDLHTAFLDMSISRHVIQMYRDKGLFSIFCIAITITPDIRFFRKKQKLDPPWNDRMI